MKGKMRAAILYDYNTPLELEEVDIPRIGPGEALVKIRACGVCHTDVSLIEGNARNLPHSLGHEGAGDVVEVGEGVRGLTIGDRVCIFLRFVCGDCFYCRTGRDNLCSNMVGQFGFSVDGGYADYAKAPARAIFKLPSNVSYEEGGVIADCVATVYRAVVRRGEVRPTDNVMVLGVGGLGLSAVLISRLVGARVIAVDITDEKLDFAKSWGQMRCFMPLGRRSGCDQTVNGRHGADRVINLVGTGDSVLTSLDSLAPSGRLVQLGHTAESFTAKVTQIQRREVSIVGNSANTRQDLVDTLALAGAEGFGSSRSSRMSLN